MRVKIAAIIVVLLTSFGTLITVMSQGKSQRGVAPKEKRDPVVYAESHALVIGVSDYNNWRKLPGVAEDIPAVAALFRRLGFNVETPRVENREEFNRVMDSFISQHGKNVSNRLVIYFAGHGYTEIRSDGLEMGSIVMKDAPKDTEAPGFDLSLVTMDELNADAIRIRAKHAMFIFDSCFAGTIFSRSTRNSVGGKAPPLILERAVLPVRQFITSGTASQEVPDRSDFRLLLEKAFDDRGADFYPRDGYVTGEELGRYLAGQVASVSRGTQTPKYGKIKEVRLQRGDMVFRLPDEIAEEKIAGATAASYGCDLAWKEVEQSQNLTELEEFLKECGSSLQAKAVRVRLTKIKQANRGAPKERSETTAVTSLGLIYKREKFITGEVKGGAVTRGEGGCEVYTEDLGNGVKLDMVNIPEGEFQMGSSDSEAGRFPDEGPVHPVTVKGFLMGRYEVTQKVWRVVAALPKIGEELNPDPSRFKGDDLPVESVSWNEVKEFIARLNRKLGLEEGKGYRLPSEAEWEYAARAGMTSPYGYGETISPEVVNYDGNYPYGRGERGLYRSKTVRIGSLGVANAFGLFDMHGNLWEFCEDEWHDSYKGAPVDGRAWVSSAVAAYRVIRGGGWRSDAVACRSAFRDWYAQGINDSLLGFRLSRTLP